MKTLNPRRSALTSLLVSIPFIASAAQPAASATAASASPASSPHHPGGALVLYPSHALEADAFGAGCWVHLYDGVDYKGQRLTLVGPIQLPNMDRTRAPWRDWDSIIVGPQATVTLYRAADFALPAVTLIASAKVRDLTPMTGRFEDINSVKVECAKPGR